MSSCIPKSCVHLCLVYIYVFCIYLCPVYIYVFCITFVLCMPCLQACAHVYLYLTAIMYTVVLPISLPFMYLCLLHYLCLVYALVFWRVYMCTLIVRRVYMHTFVLPIPLLVFIYVFCITCVLCMPCLLACVHVYCSLMACVHVYLCLAYTSALFVYMSSV